MSNNDGTSTIPVFCRVRCFNRREIAISEKNNEKLHSTVRMRGNNTVTIVEKVQDDKGHSVEREREAFVVERALWSVPHDQHTGATQDFADQKYVYEHTGTNNMPRDLLAGINCCILTYGQTGSGHKHTIFGSDADPGLVPRFLDDLFANMDAITNDVGSARKMTVEASFMEIYNEKIRDLLKKPNNNNDEYNYPKIRQHPTRGIFVEGLKAVKIDSAAKGKEYVEQGMREKAMMETKMGMATSRSHMIFQLTLTQQDLCKNTLCVSTMRFVVTAGSQRIRCADVTGEVLTEAAKIGQSISTFRKVIDVLVDNAGISNKQRHKLPPFRESVLTYVLADNLGGNSKTTMIATISPHEVNLEETLGALRYTQRMRSILCINPRSNEEDMTAVVEALEYEINVLQTKMNEDGCAGVLSKAEIVSEIEMREKERDSILGRSGGSVLGTDKHGAATSWVDQQRMMDAPDTERLERE